VSVVVSDGPTRGTSGGGGAQGSAGSHVSYYVGGMFHHCHPRWSLFILLLCYARVTCEMHHAWFFMIMCLHPEDPVYE